MNLSPPPLAHPFSPCSGTCQGRIHRKDCQTCFTDRRTGSVTPAVLEKFALTGRLKCTFVFAFRASVGLISLELDLLRNLSDDSHALDCLMWTLDLDLTHFPPLFFSPPFPFTPIVYPYSNFLPSFPFLLYTHIHPLLPSLSLRAKDMKNRLGFLRRRNESPGSNSAGKIDKSMKSVK